MPHILIIHQNGSVGKTTLASFIVRPRLGGRLFSLDKVEADAERYGESVVRYAEEHYVDYLEDLVMCRHASNTLTDVGSNRWNSFVDSLKNSGGLELFDFVLVPTDLTDKAQEGTLVTAETLFSAGLDPARLRIVLNKARSPSPLDPIEKQYPLLFAAAAGDPRIPLNPNCYIAELPIFSYLAQANLTWHDAVNDDADYDSLLAEATRDRRSQEERLVITRKLLLTAQAKKAKPIFDAVYRSLNIGAPTSSAPDVAAAAGATD
jgi:hypothetical protein